LAVLNETVNAVSEAKYLFVEEYTVYVVMVTAMTGGGQGPLLKP